MNERRKRERERRAEGEGKEDTWREGRKGKGVDGGRGSE